jgi:hypothetical protein
VQDVALLAVGVLDQRDARRPVRVVLDVLDNRHLPCLLRLKSMMRYFCLWPPPRRRIEIWPWLSRPPLFLIGSSERLLGVVERVISALSETERKRVAAVTGLN